MLTMQLFSHFCIFMMLRPKGMFPYTLAYRHVNDLRSWGGVWHAPTVYLYRQLSCIISIALPSSICYDTPTDSSYARHCRHISYIFYFLIFILHVTLTCSAHFSVHSDDTLNKQIPKTFAKSGILLSVKHFLCYDTYLWRQSCAAGNGGHIAAK